ncbi:hypothetical protein V4U95_004112 [Candida albicans]
MSKSLSQFEDLSNREDISGDRRYDVMDGAIGRKKSSLGQSQSQSQSQSQGQWSTSLSSREMANPRAGSKAKAHSMAISVTKPVAGASTSAHSTRGSRVLGSSQLNWSCPGSPSAT